MDIDVVSYIVSHLDMCDILACSLVCVAWSRELFVDCASTSKCTRHFPIPLRNNGYCVPCLVMCARYEYCRLRRCLRMLDSNTERGSGCANEQKAKRLCYIRAMTNTPQSWKDIFVSYCERYALSTDDLRTAVKNGSITWLDAVQYILSLPDCKPILGLSLEAMITLHTMYGRSELVAYLTQSSTFVFSLMHRRTKVKWLGASNNDAVVNAIWKDDTLLDDNKKKEFLEVIACVAVRPRHHVHTYWPKQEVHLVGDIKRFPLRGMFYSTRHDDAARQYASSRRAHACFVASLLNRVHIDLDIRVHPYRPVCWSDTNLPRLSRMFARGFVPWDLTLADYASRATSSERTEARENIFVNLQVSAVRRLLHFRDMYADDTYAVKAAEVAASALWDGIFRPDESYVMKTKYARYIWHNIFLPTYRRLERYCAHLFAEANRKVEPRAGTDDDVGDRDSITLDMFVPVWLRGELSVPHQFTKDFALMQESAICGPQKYSEWREKLQLFDMTDPQAPDDITFTFMEVLAHEHVVRFLRNVKPKHQQEHVFLREIIEFAVSIGMSPCRLFHNGYLSRYQESIDMIPLVRRYVPHLLPSMCANIAYDCVSTSWLTYHLTSDEIANVAGDLLQAKTLLSMGMVWTLDVAIRTCPEMSYMLSDDFDDEIFSQRASRAVYICYYEMIMRHRRHVPFASHSVRAQFIRRLLGNLQES